MITKEQGETLDKLAQFMANIADAWDAASQEQRKELARCLFQEVWIKGKEVIAVRPQLELKLWRRNCHGVSGSGDPGGIRTPDLHRDRVAC